MVLAADAIAEAAAATATEPLTLNCGNCRETTMTNAPMTTARPMRIFFNMANTG